MKGPLSTGYLWWYKQPNTQRIPSGQRLALAMGKTHRHIIWDWNGTLLDDTGLCLDIANGMLRERTLPTLSLQRYQQVFDFPVRNYYVAVGFSADDFEELSRRFIDEYDARVCECGLHAGAVQELSRVRAAGLTQTILTAARTASVEQLLERFGIRHFFDEVVGLDDHYAHSKIEAGQRWFATHETAPQDALLIGDTVHDFEVAQALGVHCRLVAHGHHSFERLQACNCEVVQSPFRSG